MGKITVAGGGGKKRGGVISTIYTIEFLDNGATCSTLPVTKRTFSITLKTHIQH